jgi:hypothetical protein
LPFKKDEHVAGSVALVYNPRYLEGRNKESWLNASPGIIQIKTQNLFYVPYIPYTLSLKVTFNNFVYFDCDHESQNKTRHGGAHL